MSAAVSSRGQTPDSPPILVAVLEKPLPTPTKAVVIRYGDDSQPDLIAVSPVGRPEHSIGGALVALQRARRDRLRRGESEVIHVTVAVPRERALTARQEARLRRLAQARHGEWRQIGSLGRGRVVLLPSVALDDMP